MYKLITFIMAVCLFLAWNLPVQSSSPQRLVKWSPQVHWRLATCMIAEASESEADHVAIAYAVRNWLRLRQKKHPHLRYGDILGAYCSVHKLDVHRRSPRQLWISQLSFPQQLDGTLFVEKPEDFPRKASWKRTRRVWLETLQRARDWSLGKLRDPCRGRAVHWGAPQDRDNRWYLPSDEPSEKLERVQCVGSLENWYYRYKTREELARNGIK